MDRAQINGAQRFRDKLDNIIVDTLSLYRSEVLEKSFTYKAVQYPFLLKMKKCLSSLDQSEIDDLNATLGGMDGPPRVNIFLNMIISIMSFDPTGFYKQIDTDGPWDFKKINFKLYENYGNFHFGAVAAAFGVPEGIALRGAGLKQRIDNPDRPQPGNPLWEAPYWDDPRDQEMIKRGYRFYERFNKYLHEELPVICQNRSLNTMQ